MLTIVLVPVFSCWVVRLAVKCTTCVFAPDELRVDSATPDLLLSLPMAVARILLSLQGANAAPTLALPVLCSENVVLYDNTDWMVLRNPVGDIGKLNPLATLPLPFLHVVCADVDWRTTAW